MMEYTEVHRVRHRLSEEWLSTIVANKVLEVGQPDAFTPTLKGLYPEVFNTEFDLRKAKLWSEIPNDFDLVVCMEVVEHLNDILDSKTPIEKAARFDHDGLKACLEGMYRCLKVGGKMFLTTPNGASVENVRRALNGWTPIQYEPHVREYGPEQIATFIVNAGFHVDRIEFPSCYNHMQPQAEMKERELIRALLGDRFKRINRGETTFIIASK